LIRVTHLNIHGLGVKGASALTFLMLVAGVATGIPNKYCTEYTYTLSCTLENRGNGPYLLREAEMTYPMFQNNSWQTVTIQETSPSVASKRVDADGNMLVVLDLPQSIDVGASLTLTITYHIESKDRPKHEIQPDTAGQISEIPSKLVREFCIETETFNTGNGDIRALAQRLCANETKTLNVVTKLLDWIIDNVSYRAFDVPRRANETLSGREGDCDDQAILFATMCRILGIPAVLQTGCFFDGGIDKKKSSWDGHLYTEQTGVGWHGWASVYVPPWGWLPIDLVFKSSGDLISLIRNAPEYNDYFITCSDVSRQDYIGEAHESMENLSNGSLYIKRSETLVKDNPASKILMQSENVMEILGSFGIFILSTFPIIVFILEILIFIYCLVILV